MDIPGFPDDPNDPENMEANRQATLHALAETLEYMAEGMAQQAVLNPADYIPELLDVAVRLHGMATGKETPA